MSEEDSFDAMCQRIIAHCRARGWYGPDDALETGIEIERYTLDKDDALRRRHVTHDPRMGFEFAPATTKQAQATERALGFALPPLLRAIYTRVANGGFGPGEGLTGVQGGYVYGQDGRYWTIDQAKLPLWATETLDLAAYEAAEGWPHTFKLPPHTWPAHFVHLCYWGCETDTYVDAASQRVYWAGGSRLALQAESLERWLETWLQGEWRSWFSGDDGEASQV